MVTNVPGCEGFSPGDNELTKAQKDNDCTADYIGIQGDASQMTRSY